MFDACGEVFYEPLGQSYFVFYTAIQKNHGFLRKWEKWVVNGGLKLVKEKFYDWGLMWKVLIIDKLLDTAF